MKYCYVLVLIIVGPWDLISYLASYAYFYVVTITGHMQDYAKTDGLEYICPRCSASNRKANPRRAKLKSPEEAASPPADPPLKIQKRSWTSPIFLVGICDGLIFCNIEEQIRLGYRISNIELEAEEAHLFCLARQRYKLSGIDYGTKFVAIDLKYICCRTWFVTVLCTSSNTCPQGHIRPNTTWSSLSSSHEIEFFVKSCMELCYTISICLFKARVKCKGFLDFKGRVKIIFILKLVIFTLELIVSLGTCTQAWIVS